MDTGAACAEHGWWAGGSVGSNITFPVSPSIYLSIVEVRWFPPRYFCSQHGAFAASTARLQQHGCSSTAATCTRWREPTRAPPRRRASPGWLPPRSPSRSPRPTRPARSTARCGARSISSRRRRGWWCTLAAAHPRRRRSARRSVPSLLVSSSTRAASLSTRRTAPSSTPTCSTCACSPQHRLVRRSSPPASPVHLALSPPHLPRRRAPRLRRHAMARPGRRGRDRPPRLLGTPSLVGPVGDGLGRDTAQ